VSDAEGFLVLLYEMALKFSFIWTWNSSVEYPGLKLASRVLSADLEGEGQ
jgi:hypothetical protein